eukprot:6795577-Pyramimonas_sp.AAC.1
MRCQWSVLRCSSRASAARPFPLNGERVHRRMGVHASFSCVPRLIRLRTARNRTGNAHNNQTAHAHVQLKYVLQELTGRQLHFCSRDSNCGPIRVRHNPEERKGGCWRGG